MSNYFHTTSWETLTHEVTLLHRHTSAIAKKLGRTVKGIKEAIVNDTWHYADRPLDETKFLGIQTEDEKRVICVNGQIWCNELRFILANQLGDTDVLSVSSIGTISEIPASNTLYFVAKKSDHVAFGIFRTRDGKSGYLYAIYEMLEVMENLPETDETAAAYFGYFVAGSVLIQGSSDTLIIKMRESLDMYVSGQVTEVQ